MKNKKKLLLILSTLIILIIAMAGVTLAIFTSKDKVKNVFGVGEIKIEVEEEFPKDPPWNQIKPIKKEVNIKNTTSNNEALIRVNITPRWVNEVRGKEVLFSGDTSDKVVELELCNILNDLTQQTSKGHWIYGKDGYYYYTEILKPQEKTEDILKSVKVNVNENTVENPKEYENKILKVDVNAEGVQPTIDAYKDTWNVQDENIKKLLNDLINNSK
ncbi:BsaA family SipW-dependent biofilm matrix protein [Paraclostridium ghonii]|uniref:BsaA family SipW-dependent biofilm matrix protein n=1 Tax=Paraclostridium ghonii TaxID=29358 RepID=UPI00202D047E|nr:BsaA family SipW-dependent biofilm matrix protein [Paeniclostridium ghonii]MCM0166477.1 BsaA family SipW-dependent biofilm matrix protein [Paeniclostridium ghonii]